MQNMDVHGGGVPGGDIVKAPQGRSQNIDKTFMKAVAGAIDGERRNVARSETMEAHSHPHRTIGAVSEVPHRVPRHQAR